MTCKPVQIEADNVERYHAFVRQAVYIVEAESPSILFDNCLETPLKAVNDSIWAEGLVATLLDFETLPSLCLPSDLPQPSNAKRAIYKQKEKDALAK